jgi:hypothetical protein
VSEFWEAYRHPEWQKKRLEIMEERGFKCQECKATDKTLNVHHSRYIRGRKPWEYDNGYLHCLCEDCHARKHELAEWVRHHLPYLSDSQTLQLVGYIKGLSLQGGLTRGVILGGLTGQREILTGLFHAWGMDCEDPESAVEGMLTEDGKMTPESMDAVVTAMTATGV